MNITKMLYRHHFTLKILKIQKIFRFKGLWGIYLNTAFRDLGLKMIGVFLPIYVFQITENLFITFLFFSLINFICVFSTWFAVELIPKIGIDMVGFLSTVMRSMMLVFLILAKSNPNFLWLVVIFCGLVVPLCRLPYHFTIVSRGDTDHFGITVSKIEIISKIMYGLGPFLGGLIIANYSFEALYIVTIVIFLLSGTVIFLDDFNRRENKPNLKRMLENFTDPSLKKFWIGTIGEGFEQQICAIVWPLYIFITVSSYVILGGIQSVSILISILLIWLVGNWIDKKGVRIMNYGIAGNIFNWVIRSLLVSGTFIFLSDLIYRFFTILIWTPYMAVFYKKSSLKNSLEFIVQRSIVHYFSCSVVMFIAAIMSLLGLSWFAYFSLAIIGLILWSFMVTPQLKKG